MPRRHFSAPGPRHGVVADRARAHPARFVLYVFSIVNMVFTGLLLLPQATASGERARFVDALFTAVSSVCVTGLTVHDTGSYWSGFGHAIILAAIAVGGLGIITLASILGIVVSRRMGLGYKMLAAREIKTERLGELRALLRVVIGTTLVMVGLIFVVLVPRFLAEGEGVGPALWHALFYATSSYNNAGISVHPGGLPTHPGDWWLQGPIMVGVFLGSIGFPVLQVLRHRWRHPRSWGLHTQLTLATTGILLVGSVLLFLLLEWRNPATMGPHSVDQKLLDAMFMSVMPRSAGFSTLPIDDLNHTSMLFLDALMFVGGGPVSTAGGIKVTTLAVLFLAVVAEARGDRDVEVFSRRVPATSLRLGVAVTMLGATIVLVGSMVVTELTHEPLDRVLFEVLSAFATCGLSTGLSAELPDAGKYVLTFLMFVGRTGTMTVGAALALRERRHLYRLPEERPIIG